MSGSDAGTQPVSRIGRVRTLPSRMRGLGRLEERLIEVERRLALAEEQLRSPELDGRALEAVRDAVRDLSVRLAEELNDLSAARTAGGSDVPERSTDR